MVESAVVGAWPRVTLRTMVEGLETPIALSSAGDGSGRLFVCEKAGRVRVIDRGHLEDGVFLDISDRVLPAHSEQGLLSLAFPFGFEESRRMYACYTAERNDLVVSRFTLDGDGRPDRAGEQQVLRLWHPFRNHNGGQLAFGPDGFLYVGVGDGGSEYDPMGYGQDPSVLLAKILRIDTESTGEPHGGGTECECEYHIPADNPFLAYEYFAPETWHWGLRNPWRFSFDSRTGDMYIADVGQDHWEEIDFAEAGRGGLNFGWSLWEGRHKHPADSPRARHSVNSLGENDVTMPVAEYDHGEKGGIAVVGGYVYRGEKNPGMQGIYLFADYGNGRLWGLRRNGDGQWETSLLAETGLQVTTFGEDDDGEVYLADYRGGVHAVLVEA